MVPKIISLLTILIPSITVSDKLILVVIWLVKLIIDYDVVRPGHSGFIYKLVYKVKFMVGNLIVGCVQFVPAILFLITTILMKAWIPFISGVIGVIICLIEIIDCIKAIINEEKKEM